VKLAENHQYSGGPGIANSKDAMHKLRDESGAILVHAALILLVLIGCTAFVFDHGVLFTSRGQAQNVADAAALAGTIARAFDEPVPDADIAADGITVQSIEYAVANNRIVGEATHKYTKSWNCPPGVPADSRCVRVDVFRNGEEASPQLPVFFGAAVGLVQQGTKAMAIGATSPATGSNCMKPWLIADKFDDVNGNGVFDLPVDGVGGDSYTAPGWTLADVGTVLTLNPAGPQDAVAPSNFFQIDVNNYYDDIVGCELAKGIGEWVDTAPGLSNGITQRGVDYLTRNGPVTVPIGMYDPAVFEANRQTGNFDMQIVNMMGFKLTGMTGRSLVGEIVGMPGDIVEGAPAPEENAGFLQVIRLVR
jgi:hypothetical protein